MKEDKKKEQLLMYHTIALNREGGPPSCPTIDRTEEVTDDIRRLFLCCKGCKS